jgi:UDP-3-O-[3-hydroxymyristoyl] glucosamine N-acyltransferase
MKLGDIASYLQIKIDLKFADIQIESINTLSDANGSQISFLDNKKYIKELDNTKAKAVILKAEFAELLPSECIPLITDEPYLTLAKATKLFIPNIVDTTDNDPTIGKNCKIMPTAYISDGAIIGDNVTIMAGSFIGQRAVIEDNTFIYPNVSIYHDCKIGKDCIVHSGTVIGSDGFGFAPNKQGEFIKIYQNGNVEVGSNVEFGANCTIDRAVFASTIIEDGCKFDNLVHIAHNCKIGQNSVIAGQSGVAGSTTLANNIVMGGQSGIGGHLDIPAFTTVMAKSLIIKSVKEGGAYAGFPAKPHKQWLRDESKIQRMIKNHDNKKDTK